MAGRLQLLCVIVGAALITVAVGAIEYALSSQAFYPQGTPMFRTYWGLPFGWLRRTILAPPPSSLTSAPTPLTVWDIDFIFFASDIFFWTLVLAPLSFLVRRWFRGT